MYVYYRVCTLCFYIGHRKWCRTLGWKAHLIPVSFLFPLDISRISGALGRIYLPQPCDMRLLECRISSGSCLVQFCQLKAVALEQHSPVGVLLIEGGATARSFFWRTQAKPLHKCTLRGLSSTKFISQG